MKTRRTITIEFDGQDPTEFDPEHPYMSMSELTAEVEAHARRFLGECGIDVSSIRVRHGRRS